MFSSQETSLKRRAASMKQMRSPVSPDRLTNNKKSFTMSKRSSQMIEEHAPSTFFSLFDKKKSKIVLDPESLMDSLDEQIAKIRGTLETMRMEDKSMGERVARVTAAIDAASGPSDTSDSSSTSLTDIKEQTELSASMTSLPSKCDSKRDSGFVYDPKFELVDPPKYCCLPNNFAPMKTEKKSRSTTAIDFIRNNIHEDNSTHRLKATSIDRLSCYSDSALLSISGFRGYH